MLTPTHATDLPPAGTALRFGLRISCLVCTSLLVTGSLFAATPTVDDLFAVDRVHDIHITAAPQDWQTLRDNYLLNDWYWNRVEWNGLNVKAAMRSRGNGSRDPRKPGLKLSFKRSSDSGPFLGLDSLILGNLAQDGTMLKNGLSFELYRRMGVIAPRLSYARVHINREYWGLYTVAEEVDEAFIQDRFGQRDGYLYEYSWADYYYFGERGEDPSAYVNIPFEAKTNSRNPDAATLALFIEAINRTPDDQFVTAVNGYLDIPQFLRLLAVETYTDDRDSILGDWGLNNFFLHRAQDSTRFTFIAWDKDWSFFAWDRPLLEHALENVLVRRLLARPELRALFVRELRRCTDLAGGAGGWLETEARRRHQLIYQSAVSDPYRLTDMGTVEDSQPYLIEFIQQRAAEVRRQLDASSLPI